MILRVLLVAFVPLSLAAGPSASAKPDIPEGCDLFANTHCHCMSVSGLRDCMIID